MSYYSVSRADRRRVSALARHERKAQAYRDLLAEPHKFATPEEGGKQIALWKSKLMKTDHAIENTRANMGKGSSKQ